MIPLLCRIGAVGLLFAAAGGCGGARPSGARTNAVASPLALVATRSETATVATAVATRPSTPSGAGSPLAGRTVVLNPGHNGRNYTNPGFIDHLVPAGRGRRKACDTTGTATAGGYSEAAFNWSVALDARRILIAAGARVVMTRSGNTGVGPCVDQRAAIGNAAQAAAVISIHADGAPPSGRGFHVIYPPDAGGTAGIYRASLRLAQAVHDAVAGAHVFPTSTYLGRNGYDERDDLAGLNLSTRPAIFVELGNMANPTDARLQETASIRERLARALTSGLARFLGGR